MKPLKILTKVKRQLSYTGDWDKEWMRKVTKNTFNPKLAKEILSYYNKNNIKAILQSDGIIKVLQPHTCKVKGFGSMDYLHIYNFHGAMIFPIIEENENYCINAYNSSNGWWQCIGNDKKIIVLIESLKSWTTQ